jgi:HK97 family phage portal protein
MSFFQTLARAFTRDPREFRAETLMGSRGMPGGANLYTEVWNNNHPQYPTNNIYASNRGYTNSALIFRCVRYTADAMGSASLRIYRSPEETKRANAEPNHNFRKLLKQPNLGQSESTFLTFLGVLLCVTGFAVVEKERNMLGEVIGLWPLRSDWLKPIPRRGQLNDWEYQVPGERPKILKSDDVIPLTYADTIDNSPTGIGPLEAALRNMGIGDALTDFIKGFMERGAMPMYIAIPNDDPYTQAMWGDQAKVDAYRAGFRERFGGLHNAVDTAVVPGIKEIKPIGFNIDELAYPDLFALNENAICQAFGISPIVVNTTSGLQQSSYNNYATARRSFYEDTMVPLWGRIDDAFTRHLLYEMADTNIYSIGFDTSNLPALKDAETERWTRATDALNVAGLTINQFLTEIEHDTIPNGDVYLVPDGVSVIGAEDMQTGTIQTVEAEGDIKSAKEIAKVTGKPPHGEKINRGVDSRAEEWLPEFRSILEAEPGEFDATEV